MQEGFREKFLHVITLVLLAFIIVGGAALVYPTWRRGESLKAQEADLRAQIEEKKKEIAHLQENQRRFRTDPDFVESIARRNRRVFPGELVFIFED